MRCRAARWIVSIDANNFSMFSPVNAEAMSTGAYSRKKILARVSSTSCLAACFSLPLGLTKSHLFKTTIAGFRAF